jgi:hypothetical protein
MNFVDELIHTLDRHSSRFRFLVRDVENGVVLSDDFRSEDFSKKTQGALKLIGWRIVDDRQNMVML